MHLYELEQFLLNPCCNDSFNCPSFQIIHTEEYKYFRNAPMFFRKFK